MPVSKPIAIRLPAPAAAGPFFAMMTLAMLSCRPAPIPSIAPEGMGTVDRDVVETWAGEFAPKRNRLIRIRPWRYRNDRGGTSGRAVVRLVPPDSMRFDFRGAFGKSGAAVIVGDAAEWAHPEGDFDALIRIAPVFWAAIGYTLEPPPGVVFAGIESGDRRVWQYAYRGDTLTFVAEGSPRTSLRAEMRRDGATFALSTVRFDTTTGFPESATVEFPLDPGAFTFEIRAVVEDTVFAADVWDEPR